MKNPFKKSAKAGLAMLAVLISGSIIFSACNKSETVTPVIQKIVGKPINSDTLSGGQSGTLLTSVGKYTITNSVTILPKDTLYVQKGVTVDVQNNAIVNVQGTLIIEGTEDSPATFTAAAKKQGSWGGFACDSAKYVSIKWTHIEYCGGPDAKGNPRRSIVVSKPIQVTMEDCWILAGADDGILLSGGCTFSMLRNTIEGEGTTDGESINIKTGATGVVAYNVISRGAGTGVKLETSPTVLNPQTNVKVYNNTIIGQGFRRGAGEPGRGISVDKNAIGIVYNNVLINNYYGLDIQVAADVKNTMYGNNYFYTTIDSTRQFFYPQSSLGKPQSSDIIVADKSDGNPMKFTAFDPSILEYTAAGLVITNGTNPKPLSGSPLIGKGNPTYNADLGAYTSDGMGNKH
jgi:hypothetical protein